MKLIYFTLLILMILTGCNPKAGKDGLNGSSCSVSPALDNSGTLIQCTDGPSSFIQNGQDATPVQMIQLCPMITGSYPNNFPEYAFLVQGKLYATMFINNKSWTSELYPGSYTTTTNGANCSFTVNQDRTLTH